jgi:hypothetical protein
LVVDFLVVDFFVAGPLGLDFGVFLRAMMVPLSLEVRTSHCAWFSQR